MKLWIYNLLFISSFFSYGQKVNDFSETDLYARLAPKNVQTVDELVAYFSVRSTSDIEKARMIYVWLAENISYDARAFNLKNPGDNSALSVFKSKKAVCAGFANLFTEIGNKLELEIATVRGLAKGYEFENDIFDNLEESINHAWNVIRIDGEWRVFDATWGEGFGTTNKKGKLESTKKFDESWFNVPPNYAIFSHLPEELNWQYIAKPLSFETFLALPFLTPNVFESGWITPDEVLSKFNDKKKVDLPIYSNSLNEFKLSAPKDRVLKKGKIHDFVLESNEVKNVYFYINEEIMQPFLLDNNKYKYTIQSEITGTYQLIILDQSEQLHPMFEYVVE
jgi:transglutaminase/protease-like cytokinesis protein 3